ncbi:sodium:proton antiporter [bacterium]|nr:sodium:proton antiporter [bacterium]
MKTKTSNKNKINTSILIGSGKGGVGKSMVSANVALGLASRGLKVGLLDADIYGPSQSHFFNLPERTGATEKGSIIPHEKHGIKILSMGSIVSKDKPLIWRGPVVHRALEQLTKDVEWGEIDILIADIPPGTGDPLISLTNILKPSGSVLVTTPQNTSINDALRSKSAFDKLNCEIIGIVTNMSGYFDKSQDKILPLFPNAINSFASKNNLKIIGEIPFDPLIAQTCESGSPYLSDPKNLQNDIWQKVITNILEFAEKKITENKNKNRIGNLEIID